VNAQSARHLAARRRWHPPERSGPAFALSLLAHGVLFIAIAFAVRWKTEPAGTVAVELWGGLPPAAVQAPPPPSPPVIVAPPRVEPPPEPRKADIVEKPVEPPKKAPPKVEPPPKPAEPLKKIAPPPKKAEPDPEQLKREAEAKAAQAAAEKQRQATIDRAMAAAGTSASSTGATGASSGSPGFSDSYKGQIAGCIKPWIAFNVPPGMRSGQHVATFEVNLLPTGEQIGPPRMTRSSGLPSYDQAVERAIRRCDPFPRPREGSIPRVVPLVFDPVETR
jgi:colicin import membrane protein